MPLGTFKQLQVISQCRCTSRIVLNGLSEIKAGAVTVAIIYRIGEHVDATEVTGERIAVIGVATHVVQT